MTEDDGSTEQEKSARRKVGEGIRSGIGVLAALKDALEETIQEARERGDLSAERAKELVKDAVSKAQAAASGARDRLDFVNHGDLEDALDGLRARVAALEESVFGAAARDAGAEEEGEEEPEES